ncbi:hypothetical protein FGW37_03975 [Streptomyces rectiverticillatus]|uniref:hypothetical protein n=1 Tax=Streptomyces rectiverticillatus TaxID=173860 RepID=UPI0015C3E10A|nr:hypothetical protein [Streptomyces rectiverticillatus]QLE70871.1 hypothetical protein FGW37_03975 [Streptomyces rectiverticillatus]
MPANPDLTRSPEEINDAIRAFLAERRGRMLHGEERRAYERLRAEWLAAVRGVPCLTGQR